MKWIFFNFRFNSSKFFIRKTGKSHRNSRSRNSKKISIRFWIKKNFQFNDNLRENNIIDYRDLKISLNATTKDEN